MIDPNVHVTSLRRKARFLLIGGLVCVVIAFGMYASAPRTTPSGDTAYLAGFLVMRIITVGLPIVGAVFFFRRRKRTLADLDTIKASIASSAE